MDDLAAFVALVLYQNLVLCGVTEVPTIPASYRQCLRGTSVLNQTEQCSGSPCVLERKNHSSG